MTWAKKTQDPNSKITGAKKASSMAKVVERLPALSSNPNTAKKKVQSTLESEC
jgi:hypothetical protein